MGNDKSRFAQKTFPIKTVDELYTSYDFVNSFTVATATTDYNLKTQQTDSFKNVGKAWLAIIWSDQDISIKLNSTSNPSIAVSLSDTPFELRNIFEISNIFITNASGATANIKVMLV
jgi:hypothetical protein